MICEASSRLQSGQLIGRQGRIGYDKMKLKASSENDETKTDEESLIVDMLVHALDFDSNTTLFGYLRYTKRIDRLHQNLREGEEIVITGNLVD